MATIREYFDTDFSYALRVHGIMPQNGFEIELAVMYDFSGYHAFCAAYFSDPECKMDTYIEFLKILQHGRTKINFDGKVTLPSTRMFPGELQIENVPGALKISARFHADPNWVSIQEITTSTPARVFIYAEADLSNGEILELKSQGLSMGHDVQFRSTRHVKERVKGETPLAFISYDSRDREIAKKVATRLITMQCPVWYDEFSLKVGDDLRESIERGLKECRKCVLVLSKNFFSNNGWTKREFNSVFTREILEEQKLILPIWLEVSKQEVYDYSPSLLNVKGADWSALGVEEVCRQLMLSMMQES